MIGPNRRAPLALALAVCAALAAASAPSTAGAAPRPAETVPLLSVGGISIAAPEDTLGRGEYLAALRLFEAGLFDSSAASFQLFAMRRQRNLLVNDAIEHVLLIRENREPGDEPLRLYARTMASRNAGQADSAAAMARAGLERFPKARIRYHWEYLLAEIARDRGDHADAIRLAMTVADSTSKSRLAPFALKLAGDETIAMGEDPQKALRLYQALLERYPASPLGPPVRAQVLEIRKKLQL